jgi:hypothetical protein
MGRSRHGVQTIRFGLGERTLYLLVETSAPAQAMLASSELVVSFDSLRYRVGGGTAALRREQRNGDGWVETPSEARSAAGAVLEIGIPLAELTAHPKGRIDLRVLLRDGETEVERHPEVAPLKIPLEVTR